jgi:hypothetical protein
MKNELKDGSSPESVTAAEALLMPEVASQRGFGEFARAAYPRTTAPEKAKVLSSLIHWKERRIGGAVGTHYLSATESTPGFLKSKEIRYGKDGIGSRAAHSRYQDRIAVPRRIYLSSITLSE